MVWCEDTRLIYGKIVEMVTEDILGDKIIKYLLRNNKEWMDGGHSVAGELGCYGGLYERCVRPKGNECS